MTDPMIPGLDAAVEAAYPLLVAWPAQASEADVLRAILTAAYPHLIEPAIKAAREDMRERCADVCWDHDSHSAIRALPLIDPTESPEAV